MLQLAGAHVSRIPGPIAADKPRGARYAQFLIDILSRLLDAGFWTSISSALSETALNVAVDNRIGNKTFLCSEFAALLNQDSYVEKDLLCKGVLNVVDARGIRRQRDYYSRVPERQGAPSRYPIQPVPTVLVDITFTSYITVEEIINRIRIGRLGRRIAGCTLVFYTFRVNHELVLEVNLRDGTIHVMDTMSRATQIQQRYEKNRTIGPVANLKALVAKVIAAVNAVLVDQNCRAFDTFSVDYFPEWVPQQGTREDAGKDCMVFSAFFASIALLGLSPKEVTASLPARFITAPASTCGCKSPGCIDHEQYFTSEFGLALRRFFYIECYTQLKNCPAFVLPPAEDRVVKEIHSGFTDPLEEFIAPTVPTDEIVLDDSDASSANGTTQSPAAPMVKSSCSVLGASSLSVSLAPTGEVSGSDSHTSTTSLLRAVSHQHANGGSAASTSARDAFHSFVANALAGPSSNACQVLQDKGVVFINHDDSQHSTQVVADFLNHVRPAVKDTINTSVANRDRAAADNSTAMAASFVPMAASVLGLPNCSDVLDKSNWTGHVEIITASPKSPAQPWHTDFLNNKNSVVFLVPTVDTTGTTEWVVRSHNREQFLANKGKKVGIISGVSIKAGDLAAFFPYTLHRGMPSAEVRPAVFISLAFVLTRRGVSRALRSDVNAPTPIKAEDLPADWTGGFTSFSTLDYNNTDLHACSSGISEDASATSAAKSAVSGDPTTVMSSLGVKRKRAPASSSGASTAAGSPSGAAATCASTPADSGDSTSFGSPSGSGEVATSASTAAVSGDSTAVISSLGVKRKRALASSSGASTAAGSPSGEAATCASTPADSGDSTSFGSPSGSGDIATSASTAAVSGDSTAVISSLGLKRKRVLQALWRYGCLCVSALRIE